VRSAAIVFGIVLAILIGADALGMLSRGEGLEGGTYSILDSHGSLVTTIGRQVLRGDQYLTEDNILYRVFRVKGQQAWAISMGKINVEEEIRRIRGSGPALGPGAGQSQPSGSQPSDVKPSGVKSSDVKPSQVHPSQVAGPDFYALPFPFNLTPAPRPPVVGIYFTHNDESYITNEGVSNVHSGPGGIHRVGAQFAGTLATKGFTIVKADDLHYPHDPGAYRRSRRTLSYLLGSGPSAVFDVHRDATPQPYYAEKVSGQWVTQIRLVVGQQNPNMMVNRGFAVALKNLSDQQHPGLVKGIFFGHGGYNQDMYPTALLLEVGAHTNAEESAMRGISLFADAVATYFGR
jgi:stage II sporulation protein P